VAKWGCPKGEMLGILAGETLSAARKIATTRNQILHEDETHPGGKDRKHSMVGKDKRSHQRKTQREPEAGGVVKKQYVLERLRNTPAYHENNKRNDVELWGPQ